MAEIRRYDDIMQQGLGAMIANQDKITDFNRGSIIHTFLDSVARIAERIYVAIRQGYNDNLRLVPYSLFKFQRKLGTPASGSVEFQRENPIPTRTIIPSSTKVSGEGKSYKTTAVGYIEPGALYSNDIPIISEGVGKNFNSPSYTINTIDSVLSTDVVAVVNHDVMTGGTNQETDSEFDARFKIFINGLSGTNDYAIMDAALGVSMVRSVSVKNHKPPLRNVYNMSIYVDDGSGSATEETITAVKLAIEGDGTSINKGHLAPGVNIRVVPPITVPVHYTVILYVYRADIGVANMEARTILAEYTNSLTIGADVIISEAITRVMKLSYVRDVKIPLANIELASDQIARYEGADIEVREMTNV
ncbi:hypothetical protein FACS1894137_05700 [Spirochaetia bacterium]|nr:hypothetical protein FACS1894137_05700 [Spirochaetia bacterium]